MINGYDMLREDFKISKEVIEIGNAVLDDLTEEFNKIDEVCEFNQWKVLSAMQKNYLDDTHFASTTGYGYNDLGRDTLESIYADTFGGEDALVRPQLVSGTHALSTALFGNLRSGDTLLSPVGTPYDTLKSVIGIDETKGSLIEHGIKYEEVSLLEDGGFDYPAIKEALEEKPKMVTIQRSKGYSLRPSLSVELIGALIAFIKEESPETIIMVDNCYGEFTEKMEPSQMGADMIVGSLIKNPGGGIAPVGGYIVGSTECVENAANQLTAPGVGKEVGPSLGVTPTLTQGFFLAPQVTSAALKTATFAAHVFKSIGHPVTPDIGDHRTDIVQAIEMENPEQIEAFCRGIQKAAPVDSFVTPIPDAMPGYDCEVIMAAGAFVQGSSIELSADSPIREPYAVYLQGGLTWPHGKIGVLIALQEMLDAEVIEL